MKHIFTYTIVFISSLIHLAAYGQDNAQDERSPGLRATHCMIYDEKIQKVILLDGTYPAIQPISGLTELWAWDGIILYLKM